MESLRAFLVAIANFILFLVVIGAPMIAFFYGTQVGRFTQFDPWNYSFGFLAAGAAFIVALPTASLLAVILDIHAQLVALNRGQDQLIRQGGKDGR